MNLLRPFETRKTKVVSTLPLKFFNTLSKKKEVFEPREKRMVKMYSCGPTVYDYQHIGNLRSYVFSDTLRRTLLYNGFAVKQVINITDVGHLTSDADTGEDKIEKRAREEGRKARDITRGVTKVFMNDLRKLNIRTDKITFPKATDHIEGQIALIKTLEEKGYTYRLTDGIYFDTDRFPDYGKLGSIDLEGQKAGARVEKHKGKKRPQDFALWKFSKESEKRQQEWKSPWGIGFPGWHAECTTMVFAELGKQIDIHTGGIDHIPIHHNNEIAQAEAVTGKQYVRYWLHNAFITVEGQKIAKSVGNTIYLRNIVDRGFSPLVYRYWLLTAHYRSPVNFTWDALGGAQTALIRLHRFFIEELGETNGVINTSYERRFHEAVNDDLDTPKAIAVLWELIRDNKIQKQDKRATLLLYDKVLGLGLHESSKRLREMLHDEEKRIPVTETPEAVQKLVKERERVRSKNKWGEADELRKAIKEKGYLVEDTEEGSEIREI